MDSKFSFRFMIIKFLTQEFIKEKYIEIKNSSQLTDGTLGTNNINLCQSCQINKKDCLGHMGFISLHCLIVHPLMINRAIAKLMRYCWVCKQEVRSILDFYTDRQLLEKANGEIKDLKTICDRCENPLRTVIRWVGGDDSQKQCCFESANPKTRKIEFITTKELPDSCHEFIMEVVPVSPWYNSDITLPEHRGLIEQYSNFFRSTYNPYRVYCDIIGLGLGRKKSYSILTDMGSKFGMLEQEIFGKRVNYCMRSVIVPNPQLSIDQVGIPPDAAHIMGVRDEDIVLFNRQPSLTRQSIMAVKVKIQQEGTKVISFNPCLCTAFNADFDGDEMNIFALPNKEIYIRDAKKLLPQNNMLSAKDGKPVVYPHQECLLGLFLGGGRANGENKNIRQNITLQIKNAVVEEKNPDKILETIHQLQTNSYLALNSETEFSLTNFKKSVKDIIDSGARGSESNYRHMFEELGKQNISPFTIVTDKNRNICNNLEKGLTYDEMFLHLQSSRESIVSIGVTTASSGYLSKKLMSSMSNVTYDDQEGVHVFGKRIVSYEKW